MNLRRSNNDQKEYNRKCLNEYDFSSFLQNGEDVWAIKEQIEQHYDDEFRIAHGIYPFEYLNMSDIIDYFEQEYNVTFEIYYSWYCSHTTEKSSIKRKEYNLDINS